MMSSTTYLVQAVATVGNGGGTADVLCMVICRHICQRGSKLGEQGSQAKRAARSVGYASGGARHTHGPQCNRKSGRREAEAVTGLSLPSCAPRHSSRRPAWRRRAPSGPADRDPAGRRPFQQVPCGPLGGEGPAVAGQSQNHQMQLF